MQHDPSPLKHIAARLLLCLLASAACGARAFGFDEVAREAEALARTAYVAPALADPRLASLSYDDYRRLRFRPEAALWRSNGGGAIGFEARFYPLGRGNTRPVRFSEIVDGELRPVVVPASAFAIGDTPLPGPADAAVGVAGWHLNFPLNDAKRSDELISFLGASYFRALGSGQRYGASARGVAVDTVGAQAEEFPAFTAFWLLRPAAGAREATFFALLDGPRITGAYRFTVRPGATTTVDVQARLHLRSTATSIATLGLTPLTSMFLAGENQPASDDYRPEVHDSDGLQLHTGNGEWLWRPLVNPRGSFTTSFAVRQLRGFGLMQRDRAFASYEDLEARYELRPSVWVEPQGDWGAGRVELLQFHTPNETHDNVVAYWVPERLPTPGAAIDLSWRLHWAGAGATLPPAAHVVQTRRGHGYREAPIPPAQQQWQIDFAGAPLQGFADGEVDVVASGNANVRGLKAIAYPNPARGGWRVSLSFERIDPRRSVELRAFLRAGERTLSETWSYAMAPE